MSDWPLDFRGCLPLSYIPAYGDVYSGLHAGHVEMICRKKEREKEKQERKGKREREKRKERNGLSWLDIVAHACTLSTLGG